MVWGMLERANLEIRHQSWGSRFGTEERWGVSVVLEAENSSLVRQESWFLNTQGEKLACLCSTCSLIPLMLILSSLLGREEVPVKLGMSEWAAFFGPREPLTFSNHSYHSQLTGIALCSDAFIQNGALQWGRQTSPCSWLPTSPSLRLGFFATTYGVMGTPSHVTGHT